MSWPLVPLGRVADVQLGKMLSPKAKTGTTSFPYLRNVNVQWGRIDLSDLVEMDFDEDERRKFSLKKGDLVVCEGGEPGRCAVVERDLPGTYFQKALMRVRPRDTQIDTRFLQRFMGLAAERGTFTRDGNQATIAHFPAVKLNALKIPLPPLSEQRHIADILDKADAIRRKRKEAIALTEELLRSAFLDMFGDPVTNPKGWPVKSLGTLGELDRGRSRHRPRNDRALLGGRYPLIQTGEVANCDGVISSYEQTYSDLGLAQSKLWPAGTLCITIAANIAKTGVLAFDACFPDSVVGFTPDKRTTTEYVQYWLGFLQPILERQAPQVAQKNINLEILRALETPSPPIDLQVAFTRVVAKIRKARVEMRNAAALSEALFSSLLARTFTVTPTGTEASC